MNKINEKIIAVCKMNNSGEILKYEIKKVRI
jgi:hypothetical protein